MTAEQWKRIRPIVESALDLDGESRAAFLNSACADPVLRREVESLLGVQEQCRLFLENPVLIEPLLPESRDETENADSSRSHREAEDFGRLDLQRARRKSSAQSLEIRELLRRRLQRVVLIALGVNGFFNGLRLLRLEPLFDRSTIWLVWVQEGSIFWPWSCSRPFSGKSVSTRYRSYVVWKL